MATSKPQRRRSVKSAQLSRNTRTAHEGAQSLLSQIDGNPKLQALLDDPEAKPLLEQLRQDASILAMAPTLRIGAARRLQGAASRRRTASHALFDACAEVRRRIKLRYRGPKHAALRKAFGEGLPASPAKPETVLLFVAQILEVAPGYPAELREVRVGPPTLQRLSNLQSTLRSCAPERVELRTARRQVSESLVQVASRVSSLCGALIAIAARVCPTEKPQAPAEPEIAARPIRRHARQRT